MKRVFETIVVFFSILATIVSKHGTHNAVRTPCDHNNGGCSFKCLVSTNEQGYSCACPTGIPLLSDKKNCAHEGHSFLLVANNKNILKISLDDSNYTVEELELDGLHGVFDVDFDPLEGKIYWINTYANVIRRAYLNGSEQQDIVSSDLTSPSGIAIDSIARKLYWTDYLKYRIEMSDLNGTNRKVIMRDETSGPEAIVVDTRSRRIYWTDSTKHRIESSSLDGTSRSVVVNTYKYPVSLALDDERRIIYWGYEYMEKIEMADLDGIDRRVLISNDKSDIFGLSLLGDYIYWTNMGKKVIERADKVTGDNRQVIVDNLYHPLRLKSIILRNITEQKCDSLVNPQHGYIRQLTNNNSANSVATFACHRGYTLVGEENTTCLWVQNKLQWSNLTPQCVKEQTCDSLVNPQHGYIRQLTNNYLANSVATFACHRGYTLVGEENTTCLWVQNKLQWSNPIPQCVKGEKCKGLSFDAYKITYDPEREEDFGTEMEYPNGTRATVRCEDGFEIFPFRLNITNATTTDCVNGQWKPDIVNCTPARCSCTKLPPELMERKRKFKYCDQFAPNGMYDQMTECEEGYSAIGHYPARCCFGVWSIHTHVTPYNRCIRNKSVKDCHLDLKVKDDLTAVHRNHIFEGQEMDFVHNSTVKFSCKSFYSTLEGAKNVTCIDGQWSKQIPKCKRTSGFDFLYPPFLWVSFANFYRINTDDGRVMIPKETLFKIGCWSPEGRQLQYNERNTAGKQFMKVNISSKDIFSSVKVINPVIEKTEATVECINSKGISTEFNIVIADTCEVDENELNRRGLQVVPDSRQRIYVEGDRIQVECSSNEHRTDPFIIICKSGREWEYANNMVC